MKILPPDREIYANAPLRLVAAEVRYPFAPRLAAGHALANLHEALGAILPLVDPLGEHTFELTGPMPQLVPGGLRVLARFFSLNRTSGATITPDRAIIETTDYRRYEQFRSLVERVLGAVANLGPPVAVQRVGLRYIDEIRSPLVTESPGVWDAYINTNLLAASRLASPSDMTAQTWNGSVGFVDDDVNVTLRYGALNGYTVDPAGPLKVLVPPEPSPFFLLDCDSFWNAIDELPKFDVDEIVKRCDRLHEPVRAVFESCISETLRDSVFRKERMT